MAGTAKMHPIRVASASHLRRIFARLCDLFGLSAVPQPGPNLGARAEHQASTAGARHAGHVISRGRFTTFRLPDIDAGRRELSRHVVSSPHIKWSTSPSLFAPIRSFTAPITSLAWTVHRHKWLVSRVRHTHLACYLPPSHASSPRDDEARAARPFS